MYCSKSSNPALVSVVTPCFNAERYIGETIESVTAQTYINWELLIIDDGSSDKSAEIITEYIKKDPRIHYIYQENSGAAAARTKGMHTAKGKYVAFLDSDDLWHPDKLEKQLSFMRKSGALFSATAYEQIGENGDKNGKVFYPPEKCGYRKMLLLGNPIGNSTVIYDREILGDFTVPDIEKRNDFALWLRILHDCDYCLGMRDVLASYRLRGGSISSNKLGLIKYHWRLYREIERLGFFKSCFYLLALFPSKVFAKTALRFAQRPGVAEKAGC